MDIHTEPSKEIALNSCSVLIPSCDAYADLWPPFITLLRRHWPDCPYPIYLGTNNSTITTASITCIKAGHGNIWSDRVSEQLQQLKTEYVILFLEDFFLRRSVDTKGVSEALKFLDDNKGHMLRLVPRPPPDIKPSGDLHFGRISPGAPYRLSTQVAIWRRSSLLSLMRPGESIWEFELVGSRRSDVYEGFYSSTKSLVPYGHHVVERGKWFPHEVLRYKWSKIGCDFDRRPIMGFRPYIGWVFKKVLSMLLDVLPWQTRGRVVSAFKRRFG